MKILQPKGHLHLLEQPVEGAYQWTVLMAVGVCHVPGKQLGIHLELADAHAHHCQQSLDEAIVAAVSVVCLDKQLFVMVAT